MGLTRRAFLQRSGLLLAALGLSEAGLSLLTERYQQVLAQPTRRKLALLVGINQYPEQVCDCTLTRGTALNGCLTDLELQRELLIHRFGFQPSDIVTLTDQQATRQAIEEAFLFHLTEQAQAGDVVVFHFSGLGSRFHWDTEERPRNTLVPVDGVLPTAENPTVNDLLEETLGLLLRSLRTEQITTVIDASYADLGRVFQGNLRIRSRPNALNGQPSENELAFQDQLMSQFGISPEQLKSQWQSGQLPGVILNAARENKVATEGQWNGFSTGLFTYALTQQLWWTTPATTLRTSFCLASGTVKQFAGIEQQPSLSGLNVQNQRIPAYNLLLATSDAEGVIRAIEEDGKVQLWLAGLPTAVIENYGASVLAVIPPEARSVDPPDPEPQVDAVDSENSPPNPSRPTLSTPRPLLQIRSRDGLTFKARPCCGNNTTPQVGQLVQEVVRILPRNIGLTVALDASLERIERVDATSAFSGISRVSSVIAGEPADFLFGKTLPDAPTLTASLSPPPTMPMKRGYGLFLLGRDAIPNTLIQEEEAVKTAIHRITPQLRTLLALKLLRLTANRGSSRLDVQATLEMTAPQERILMQQETIRSRSPANKDKRSRVYTADLFAGDGGVTLPVGSRIRYRLQNNSNRPVYFILLGLDPSGNPIAFFSAIDETMIAPGETRIIPQAISDWIMQGPSGLAETHLIFSRSPLTQSYQMLKAASKSEIRQIMLLHNPLDVVQTVLQDLHQASADILPPIEVPTDTYALDVNAWATLSFIHQVVEV